jgi:Cu2+-exporting ATPase
MNGRMPSGVTAVAPIDTVNEEVLLASRTVGDGLRQTELSVPTIHCGGCIQRIESGLRALPRVETARVNLSARRVTVRWHGEAPPPLIVTLEDIGYPAYLHGGEAGRGDPVLTQLLRSLAIAGFAAGNIMLLSVSVWSGAEPATRDLLHWISAAIALPALAYSGRIFFRPAWHSVRKRQANMDVPISIGVLLAAGMSLYETASHGAHAYFDASVSLLFFLLIGRTLDYLMRERAQQAVSGLARLAARGAVVLQPDGTSRYLPANRIEPGMTIMLAAGERVPVDARVARGTSELDCSLVIGESLAQAAAAGSTLQAGTLNLTGPLVIVATAAAADSFLAEMVRMMEVAESGKSIYRRIADRAAALYAPAVHSIAFLTFIGWIATTGDLRQALTTAIAVLIVTCPCALGLAVPMVHVVAARRLFESGILVKDGGAMERLAEIDTVVFDKTGTLTVGDPRLVEADAVDSATLALAAAIATHSRHPYSRALAALGGDGRAQPVALDSVTEHPGSGLEARYDSTVYRLGRDEWAVAGDGRQRAASQAHVTLSRDGQRIASFRFEDRLRPDVAETIAQLIGNGIGVEVISGDAEEAVGGLAAAFGLPYAARVMPADKVARIAALSAEGHKVLMVGDGLNDAPALIAAHASMAPASAADVGRNAADLVFLRDSLRAVPQAIAVSRGAARLVRQIFALAIAYNAVAVPVAMLGFVTPLIAAVAMSSSSIIVVANALRLRGVGRASPRSGIFGSPRNAGASAVTHATSRSTSSFSLRSRTG